jgi:small subunit ribosomal protein S8
LESAESVLELWLTREFCLELLNLVGSEQIAKRSGCMNLTDPIGDMLSRIKNALTADHPGVDIPASKIKSEIARILYEEGYISKYEVLPRGNQKILRLTLKYGPSKKKIINVVRRVSTPGRHIYVGKDNIPRVMQGFGVAILSTPRGILSDAQARAQGVGGEVLCLVW